MTKVVEGVYRIFTHLVLTLAEYRFLKVFKRIQIDILLYLRYTKTKEMGGYGVYSSKHFLSNISARNNNQKLVGHFYEDRVFYRLLIAVPLKMCRKFSQPKQILVGQMLKLVRKWPMADCYF